MKGRLLLHAHNTRLRESPQPRHRGFWLTGSRLVGILDQSKCARIIGRLRHLQRGMDSRRGPDC